MLVYVLLNYKVMKAKGSPEAWQI